MSAPLPLFVGLCWALLATAQQVSAQPLRSFNLEERSQSADAPGSVPFGSVPPDAVPPELANLSLPSTATPAPQEESARQLPVSTATTTCMAGCNPNAPFFFRPPSEAIAPVSPVAEAPASPLPMTVSKHRANREFGLVQISNPLSPAIIPATRSDYQAASPPSADPATAPDAALAPPSRVALTPPVLRIQGVYIYQGDESSARARFSGVYPLTQNVQVGGSVDLATGDFSENNENGVSINELYLATSLRDLPNLRFVVGQLDLTSYFDRNSFAKDRASQFFNPIFQTNAALAAAGIGSRPGALLNWSVTDSLEARAAVFSSDRSISDFSLDGFAGEVGLRLGENFIIRGTYASGRDGGSGTSFQEVGQVNRSSGFGVQSGDREDAYGVNAELFIPSINLGLFGRYGHYNNRDINLGGDTYVFGLTFLDLFLQNDRLGIGYGRELSNDRLRREAGNGVADAAEIFYDFPVLPHLRLGLTFQALDNFSETIAGVRVRTEFDLLPRRTP